MRIFFLALSICCYLFSFAQNPLIITDQDRRSDVEMMTTAGTMIIRLSDSTPIHRDNFILLAKRGYLDSMLFHRVINHFMAQAGDPNSKSAEPGKPLGNGGPGYTLPAEMNTALFHKKGALAAARLGDNVNPSRESSGSQFYIVHGRKFTDRELDSVQVARLGGRHLAPAIRDYYKNMGGTPQLDGNYTVFGEVVKGLEVIDKIASSPTSSGPDRDRPLEDIRIISVKLINRDNKLSSSF